jgi:hypothetical protein
VEAASISVVDVASTMVVEGSTDVVTSTVVAVEVASITVVDVASTMVVEVAVLGAKVEVERVVVVFGGKLKLVEGTTTVGEGCGGITFLNKTEHLP